MQLTERDYKIVNWIDSHGYVIAQQVFMYFQLNPKRGYRRLRLLVENGYLQHKRILFGQPGVYLATLQGIALIADDPERPHGIAQVRAATLKHSLLLVDLSRVLVQKTGGTWKTERKIRREKGFVYSQAARPHIPDGVLTMPGGTSIAVELELTAKGTRRLENILRGYARMAEFTEVWYVVQTSALAQKVHEFGRKMPFIKIYLLKEVLNGEETVLGTG